MPIRAPRGTSDLLPPDVARYRRLEETARRVFALYGCGEIRTPIFEDTALFVRSIGEVTDIVEKEMFTLGRSDDDSASLSLRPEGTAGVVRAYLQHALHKTQPFSKFFYIGPMFRYERPQAGRSRQFDHIGVEVIGSREPMADVEAMAMAAHFLDQVGLTEYSLRVNSIGCPDCRAKYRELLKQLLAPRLKELCELCRTRYERNVFRVLDCKVPRDREIAATLPPMLDHLCTECAAHFQAVQDGLKAAQVPFVLDGSVVRGFDYYTRTVFEVTHSGVGARSAVCGGGRYDNLVADLGGPPTPAFGFAVGVVPLLVALDKLGLNDGVPAPAALYVASADDASRPAALTLVQDLRRKGLAVELDLEGRSLKAQLRCANRLKVRFTAVVGPDEINSRSLRIKDMSTGAEQSVSFSDLAGILTGAAL